MGPSQIIRLQILQKWCKTPSLWCGATNSVHLGLPHLTTESKSIRIQGKTEYNNVFQQHRIHVIMAQTEMFESNLRNQAPPRFACKHAMRPAGWAKLKTGKEKPVWMLLKARGRQRCHQCRDIPAGTQVWVFSCPKCKEEQPGTGTGVCRAEWKGNCDF